MKKILTKSITTIMYLLLITLLSASCTKEATITHKQQSKITIRVEDYGGADVKSSTQTSPICTDAFRLNDKYFATMQLIEDQGQATNHALTKADNYKYTILVFDSGNKLVQKVEGTVTNGEGDFTIDYNKTTGKITKTGTYKFVCVANGTLSATLGSTATSITFTRQQDISKPALISDVLTKTITTAQVNSNTVPDLDFLMRHKESGLRVKIVSEAEDIPSGLKVNLKLQSAEPNTAKYNLPNGVDVPATTTTTNFPQMNFPDVSAVGTKEFTTGYLYFLGGTGLNKDLQLTYTDATNKTLGGVNLSKLTTDLFNLPELKANRRYTVVVTFTPVANNNLTKEQIMELPAWRFAERNLNAAGNGLAANDLTTSSGYFTHDQAKVKTLTLGGKTYHCPGVYEILGIFPDDSYSYSVFPKKAFPLYSTKEKITYNGKNYEYNATYWNNNGDAAYGIKLYTDIDYSHACAYRYRLNNINTISAHLELMVVYLGNDAKYYLNLKDKTELQNLFEGTPAEKVSKILKFPCAGYKHNDDNYVKTLYLNFAGIYWTSSLLATNYATYYSQTSESFLKIDHNPTKFKKTVRLCR